MPSPRMNPEWRATIQEKAGRVTKAAARLESLLLEDPVNVVRLRAQEKVIKLAREELWHVLYN